MACQKRNHRDSGELGRIESKTCTDKFSHPAVDSIGQQGPRKGGGKGRENKVFGGQNAFRKSHICRAYQSGCDYNIEQYNIMT